MKKLFYLTIVILLYYTTPIEAQSVKVKDIINDYLKVTFDDMSGTNLPLIKWENIDTISYFIVGNQKYLGEKEWNAFLSDIEIISGLHFCESKTITKSGILIYIGDIKSFFEVSNTTIPQRLTKEISYWSSRRWNNFHQLTWAGFCIVPDQITNKQVGSYYLKKLFLKSLGMLGNSENNYSIYSKSFNTYNSIFTRDDKKLLKLHYNKKIKAGMSFQEVKTLITEKIDLESLSKEKL